MIRSRMWTLWLWSVSLALTVATTDRAWREAIMRGRERSALLVPAGQPPPHRRDEAEKSVETYPEVASAEWLSPAQLALEATTAFARDSLPEIFPDEEAWLPWVLEVRFRDPLAGDRIGRRIADLGEDPAWRLVLWDRTALAEDAQSARRAVVLGGALIAFLLIGGLQSVRLGPARRGRFLHESILGAFATCATVAAMGGVARYAGDALDARAWIVALGSGLVLAAGLGPCLRGRVFAEAGPIIPLGRPPSDEEVAELEAAPSVPAHVRAHSADDAGAGIAEDADGRSMPEVERELAPEPPGAVLSSEMLEQLAAAGASEVALAELDEELHPHRSASASPGLPSANTAQPEPDTAPERGPETP